MVLDDDDGDDDKLKLFSTPQKNAPMFQLKRPDVLTKTPWRFASNAQAFVQKPTPSKKSSKSLGQLKKLSYF